MLCTVKPNGSSTPGAFGGLTGEDVDGATEAEACGSWEEEFVTVWKIF